MDTGDGWGHDGAPWTLRPDPSTPCVLKADLIWVGETARGLVRLGIAEHEAVVSAPMTLGTLEQLPEPPEETPEETSEETEEDVLLHRNIRSHSFRPGCGAYPVTDFDKARQLAWTMVERSWRDPNVPGVGYVSSKGVSLDQMALAMTTMYLFGSVDQIRANIRAEVDLLYDLYKQQEDEKSP